MNDSHDHPMIPSQTDPPRGAMRRALGHIPALLKAFFLGSRGLAKEYAPKAWEGFNKLLLKPRALVMLFKARGELAKARAEAGAKTKTSEGELEISKARAKAIILEAEGKKELRMAKAEQIRTDARRRARFSDAKAKRHIALAARTRQGLKLRKTKPAKIAAPQLPKPPDPTTNGTNGHAADVNKTLQPEA
jgi:hypothetical protein